MATPRNDAKCTEFNSFVNYDAGNENISSTVPITPAPEKPTDPNGYAPTQVDAGSSDTIPAYLPADAAVKTPPVVGWLICVAGICRGQDFHLHSDWNYVGRDPTLDVVIPDPKVDKQPMIRIAYEPRMRTFTVAPCERATNLSYCGGEALYAPRQLKAYDRISLGDTELMFIPLCGELFVWEEK